MERPDDLFWFCNKESIFARQRKGHNLGESVDDATHYMMDGKGGGVLVVPNILHQQFLMKYAQDLQKGVVHYLIERRTPLFRWMIDLDFYGPRMLKSSEILGITRKIQVTVQSFYPDVTGMTSANCFFDIVVLTTEPGKKPSGEIKTGLHLVMPNLPVTQQECLDMRVTIVAELELLGKDLTKSRIFENMVGWNCWQDIVDECVYKSNGLRMPGSHKTIQCPVCNRDSIRKKSCDHCGMLGFWDGKCLG